MTELIENSLVCKLLFYFFHFLKFFIIQWWIQDFLYGGANLLFNKIFGENCMKMKEIRLRSQMALGPPMLLQFFFEFRKRHIKRLSIVIISIVIFSSLICYFDFAYFMAISFQYVLSCAYNVAHKIPVQ